MHIAYTHNRRYVESTTYYGGIESMPYCVESDIMPYGVSYVGSAPELDLTAYAKSRDWLGVFNYPYIV